MTDDEELLEEGERVTSEEYTELDHRSFGIDPDETDGVEFWVEGDVTTVRPSS